LVLKYAGDHVNLEEEHNGKYKTHMILVNLCYRVGAVLFAYMLFYWSFMLGDLGKSFRTGGWDYAFNPTDDGDNPTRYESLYMMTKPQKY